MKPLDPPQTRERQVTPLPEHITLYWRIHYADGTKIGSHESTWAEAKRDNVIAVVHAVNDEAPAVEIGTPYYWMQDDWIARTWDVTLYLRQTGLVKFGRWTSHALFRQAWVTALRSIAPERDKNMLITDETLQHGLVSCSHSIQGAEGMIGPAFQLFYDNGQMHQGATSHWVDVPSDGVLCATYSVPYGGILMRFAMRRYTFYFWRGHELINTDDLDTVLLDFPQCKIGVPAFQGKSYRHMGLAIAAAYADDLKDVRQASPLKLV